MEDMEPAELLAYYRHRCERFEQERGELLARVDACEVKRRDAHALDRENWRLIAEVRELQQALSEAQAYIFEERERLLALKAENETLHRQELQDRRRIEQLLALTDRGRRLPRPSAPATRASADRGAGLQAKSLPASAGDGSAEALQAAQARIEQLHAQLAQQCELRQAAEAHAAATADDARQRREAEAASAQLMEQRAEHVAMRLEQSEAALASATKELILSRQGAADASARARASAEELARSRASAAKGLAAVQAGAARALAEATAAARAGAEQQLETALAQLARLEAAHADLETEHAQVKGEQAERCSDLEAALTRERQRVHALEHRRALDAEGWDSDVALLRKQLAAVERRLLQTRLAARLDDDERLDALLDGLDRRAPDPLAPREANGDRAAGCGARPRSGAPDAQRRAGCRPPGAAAVLAAELRRIGERLGPLDARARGARRGGQENRGLSALPG